MAAYARTAAMQSPLSFHLTVESGSARDAELEELRRDRAELHMIYNSRRWAVMSRLLAMAGK